MPQSSTASDRTRPRALSLLRRHAFTTAAIVALAAPLFLVHAGRREVAGSVEERVAITAREMWRAGDWVLPTLNGEPRLAKPPLSYWLPQSVATVRGTFDDQALHIPFGLAAVLVLVATYGLGCLAGRRDAGCVAAGVLFSTPLFVKFGARATPDTIFLTCVTGAWFFYGLTCELFERAPAGSARVRWSQRAFYGMLVLAGLAKGPIFLVVVILPILVEAAVTRSRRPLRALWSPSGIALLVGGSVIWPALVLARLSGEVPEGATMRDWVMQSLGKVLPRDDVDRYLHHPRPWHFYVGRIAAVLGMWIVFLPAVLWPVLRRRPLFRREAEEDAHDPWTARFLSWFLTVLVVFSLVSEKKTTYILPLVPAGALLVAGAITSGYARWRGVARTAAAVAAGLCGVASAASLALPFAPELAQRVVAKLGGSPAGAAVLAEHPWSLVALAAIPCASFLALRPALRSRSPLPAFAVLGVTCTSFLLVYNDLRIALIPPAEQIRDETIAAAATLAGDRPIVVFGIRMTDFPGGMLYYLDRRVEFVRAPDAGRLLELSREAAVLTSVEVLNGLGARLPEAITNADLQAGSPALAGPAAAFGITHVVNPNADVPRNRIVILKRRT